MSMPFLFDPNYDFNYSLYSSSMEIPSKNNEKSKNKVKRTSKLDINQRISTGGINKKHPSESIAKKKIKRLTHEIKVKFFKGIGSCHLASLDKENIMKNLKNQFLNFYSKLGFTDGIFDLNLIEKKLETYLKITESFEFNDNFERSFFQNLNKINQKITNGKIENQAQLEFLKDFLNDVLIFTSLTPSSIKFAGLNSIQRHSIEIILPKYLESIIAQIAIQDTIDLTKIPCLNHINIELYKHASIIQKIIQANLTNLSTELKKELTENSFYKKFINYLESIGERAGLEWMFACSGAIGQRYLNTCVPASVCQDIVSKIALLPQAIILAEKTLAKLISKNTNLDGVYKEYFLERIQKEKKSLDHLKDRILEAFRNSAALDFDRMHQFTLEWSRIVQRIGLLVDIDEIGHPTTKPLASWLISAVVMVIPVLYQHITTKTIPSIKMRIKGSNTQTIYPKDLISKTKDISSDFYIHYARESRVYDEKKTLQFWKQINASGGSLLSNDWHSIYIKAINYYDTKVFLIGDPKSNTYQVKSFEEFFNFIKNSKFEIDS